MFISVCRQVEFKTQGRGDRRPILWAADRKCSYLKFYIFQVCEEH